ncbi:hypothetical protein [Clostridium cellulovorans]|uniref:Uncharacterized protein n=1 Tax=Clostridium cellulovorans (strain ATCC 35296 / DSM 3052 / OCM 3 / 743B) TaxID=573061 RepID=D9SPZ6_CLOC7|nr:hypothetical protein [Clostridium cellulovorans]ADL52132.1 hypothetical protein Clocel_2417 [Clostridium cellulovorans 743B]
MKNVCFENGIVVYDEFSVAIEKPLGNQLWELKEDLLQVKYFDKYRNIYIIDMGWYPEFNPLGKLKIVIVRNFQWDNPVYMRTGNIQDVYSILNDCIDYINRI